VHSATHPARLTRAPRAVDDESAAGDEHVTDAEELFSFLAAETEEEESEE
jgi:hypothetical protein